MSPARNRDPRAADFAPAGVVFDLDGVLIDSGAHHRAAWRAVLDELRIAAPDDFWRLTIGRPAEEAVERLLRRAVSVDEAVTLAARKREHYRRIARSRTPAVPGVPAFIAMLERHGVPYAVATSASRREAAQLLADAGLDGRLPVVVTADDVARGKPDPEVYVRAAAAIGVAAGRCLAFEDAPAGITAARRAGMQVIGVTTSHTDAELRDAGAIATIPSFDALGWPLALVSNA